MATTKKNNSSKKGTSNGKMTGSLYGGPVKLESIEFVNRPTQQRKSTKKK